MSKTTCRYFLQGNCKFGDRCNFFHPGTQDLSQSRQGVSPLNIFGSTNKFNALSTFNDNKSNAAPQPQSDSIFSSSINKFAVPATQPTAIKNEASKANKPVQELTNQALGAFVSEEMKVWINSGMWPFSCFAVGKDLPCILDFEDFSPEEVRFDAYEAQQKGEFEKYKCRVADMYSNVLTKIKAVSDSAHDLNWLNTNVKSSFNKSVDNKSSNSPLNCNPSVFGTQSNSNVLTNSAFGNNNAFSQNSNFGLNNNSLSITPQQSSLSTFSFKQSTVLNTNQNNSATVFGSSTPTQPNISNNTNKFPVNTTFNFINNKPSVNNQLGSSPLNNLKNDQLVAPVSTLNNGLFGAGNGIISKTSNISSKQDNSIYSKLDQLTEKEKAQFSAVKFCLGQIPTKPPAKEFCF